MLEAWPRYSRRRPSGVEGFERIVALKRILPSIAEDEEFITMFIDEAKIAVQLQHANIAQIFDLGKVDDSYFIALEYVNGRDLRGIFDDLRKMGQAMPMPQVCHLIMQLCEGLDYAHNKRDAQGRDLNLVHRDVSPQNVLIGYEGEVKLIDFGIAKAAGKASKTQAGILKGKFGYMSPEQVRGLPIDRRSDIFALGIVLYEMLTGERLFIGESDFSTLEKVRNVEIIPPSSFNSDIPEKLERIVLKALEKNVEDRYQNAIDLHDDLQMFMHSVGQFVSRKDLSAWMKRTFADDIPQEGEIAEIDDDVEEIEEVELLNASSWRSASSVGFFGRRLGRRGIRLGRGREGDPDLRQGSGANRCGAWRCQLPCPKVATKPWPWRPPRRYWPRWAKHSSPRSRPADRASGMARAQAAACARPTWAWAAIRMRRLCPRRVRFPAFAAPGAGVPRKSGAVPIAGAAEPARSPFDLPKPVFRQTLIGGVQAPTLPSPNPSVRAEGPRTRPSSLPNLGMQGAGLPAPNFPGTGFPGAPVPPASPRAVCLFLGHVCPRGGFTAYALAPQVLRGLRPLHDCRRRWRLHVHDPAGKAPGGGQAPGRSARH